MRKILFSNEQQADIMQRYANKQSCNSIAKIYGVSAKTILRFLKKRDIEIRKRKNYFDETIFDVIDTPEKAYWLGFILADGYVNQDRGFLAIKLSSVDENHLNKFARFVKAEDSIIYHETHNTTGNLLTKATLNSKAFVEKLNALNLLQGKSCGKEQLPPINSIPRDFIKDYIRGIWDGDGNLSLKNISVISSIKVLQFIQEYLHEECGANIGKVMDHCNTYRIYVCRRCEVVATLKHLYYDGCVALDRKYDLAQFIIDYYCRLEPKLLKTLED